MTNPYPLDEIYNIGHSVFLGTGDGEPWASYFQSFLTKNYPHGPNDPDPTTPTGQYYIGTGIKTLTEGMNGDANPHFPPEPPTATPCEITQTQLTNAADQYAQAIRIYDDLVRRADPDAPDGSNYLRDAIKAMKDEKFWTDLSLINAITHKSALVADDVLATLLDYPAKIGYLIVDTFVDGTDIAIEISNSQGEIDPQTMADGMQVGAAILSEAFLPKYAEGIKNLVAVTNISLDEIQNASNIAELYKKHAEAVNQIDNLQSRLDRINMFNANRAEIEQNIKNLFDAASNAFMNVYGDCITQAKFQNGNVVPTMQRAVAGNVTQAPAALPTLLTLGVISVSDPQLGGQMILGTRNADAVAGTPNSDFILAGAGNDKISSMEGDDVVFGNAGDDIIDLGDGEHDVAGYAGNSSEYKIDSITGGIRVTDLTAGRDGTDTVSKAEFLRFQNGMFVLDPLLGGLTSVAASIPTHLEITGNFTVSDQTTGLETRANGDAYAGPVANLTRQIIILSKDSLNITATAPNAFLHSGSGMDGLNVSLSNGNNILDGGTGSNFLTGGTGNDTFYLDDRGPAAPIWSTIVNFHAGDAATVWGVNQADFQMTKLDDVGAPGYTGLDLIFSKDGQVPVSFTIAGYTSADLDNGKLTMTWGHTTDLPSVPGSDFVTIYSH